MRQTVKSFNLIILFLFASFIAIAQDDAAADAENPALSTESPLDDVVEKPLIDQKRILAYDHLREGDIFWQKRVWRVIDLTEKMNKSFAYPKEPFINILMDNAKDGTIRLFSTLDDEFTEVLSSDDASAIGASTDTIITFDPDTYEEKIQVVTNELNVEDIKRFRIKEDWFFDSESSTLQVRILGIAPLREVYDDNDNFLYEQPLFWAYYPELREILARKKTFNPFNDAVRMSWEDIFEMRFFSSYIYKESNVYDRRLKDYKAGLDILVEADKIKNKILNFEHDLWSY